MSVPSTSDARELAGRYTKLAGIYDAWTWLTESKSLDAALQRAAIRDGEAVLEVAVGTGLLFREILRRNRTGHNAGVDITEAMLLRARRKAASVGAPFELTVQDARALSFANATFDLVVNNNMLGLLPERDVAPILSEMLRVLRPGGRLLVVTMMRPGRRLPELVYRIGAVWLGGWHDVSVEPLVAAAGFEVMHTEIVTQLGIPSQVLSARRPMSERDAMP
jgi:ubiquinone/menaquinone biosynthesis C-methylase UbiE